MGFGYVYSSAHTSGDAAEKEARKALKQPLDLVRRLTFESGRLETFWKANCVGLGLAAAFVEPLEATSIHACIVQVLLFADALTQGPISTPVISRYNHRVAAMYDDFKDFIVLHYLTPSRRTAFWEDASRIASRSRFAQLVPTWKKRFPTEHDFATASGTISANLFLPVLDGLNLLSKSSARRTLDAKEQMSGRRMIEIHREFASNALSHADFLQLLTHPPRAEQRRIPVHDPHQMRRTHEDQ